MNHPFDSVFISYASEDLQKASELYDYLLKNGYKPWLDKKKLLPGQSWDVEIKQALRRADFIILLLSKVSVSKRGYVQKEFKLALEYIEEKLETDIYIIPFKLDDCIVPIKLGKYQWISRDEKDAFKQILSSLELQRKTYKEDEQKNILSKLSFEYDIINKKYVVDSKPKSDIEIEYPKFKNINNNNLEEINSIIEGLTISSFVEGRKFIKEVAQDNDLTNRHIEYEAPGYSISSVMSFTLISKDFISILEDSYAYTGGAHGNYSSVGYSYILNPVESLNWHSFITNKSILNYISKSCKNYIINVIKNHDGGYETEGEYFIDDKPLKSKIGNFKNFFLDKDSLNIIFNPYEVTAYAYGQHVVPILYSDLLRLEPNSELLKKLLNNIALVSHKK